MSVLWPDGTRAAGARIELYPSGFSTDVGTPYTDVQLDGNGNGVLDCSGGCTDLQGFFSEPASGNGADGAHGGNDCWILLHASSTLAVSLTNGEQATLAMEDLPCDRVYYNPSDLSSVAQSLATGDGNYGYAGSWQDARSRLS